MKIIEIVFLFRSAYMLKLYLLIQSCTDKLQISVEDLRSLLATTGSYNEYNYLKIKILWHKIKGKQ